jgi:hypothetical protein
MHVVEQECYLFVAGQDIGANLQNDLPFAVHLLQHSFQSTNWIKQQANVAVYSLTSPR